MEVGYGLYHGILAPEACVEAVSALSLGPSRAGTRHMMKHPVVARLACDHRLLEVASRYVGMSAVPFSATLFEKSEQANWLIAWHQDTALPMAQVFDRPGWGPWSQKAGVHFAHAPAEALGRVIALRLHLDHSEESNGPLRVVPGSHLAGVLSDPQVQSAVTAGCPVECVCPRGGVIAMRPLLIHASSKSLSGRPRRVLHILYADSLDLAPGIRLAVA